MQLQGLPMCWSKIAHRSLIGYLIGGRDHVPVGLSWKICGVHFLPFTSAAIAP
jgi:hypothetical protein